MAETTHPMSSIDLEDHDKIPGTDWACPYGGTYPLEEKIWNGQRVTDEDVVELADGRMQYLSLYTYPSTGFESVQVMDAETNVRVARRDGMAEEFNTDLRIIRYPEQGDQYEWWMSRHRTDIKRPALTGRMPRLGGRRELKAIHDTGIGILSVIGAVDDEYIVESRYNPDNRRELRVNPSTNRIDLDISGPMHTNPQGQARFSMMRGFGRLEGSLGFYDQQQGSRHSSVEVQLDELGRPRSAFVNGKHALKLLGVRFPWGTMRKDDMIHLKPNDPLLSDRLLPAMADAIGQKKWQHLDLTNTARQLYANLDKDIKPTEHIATRGYGYDY